MAASLLLRAARLRPCSVNLTICGCFTLAKHASLEHDPASTLPYYVIDQDLDAATVATDQ